MAPTLQDFAAQALVHLLFELKRDFNDFTPDGLKSLLDEAIACDFVLEKMGYWENSEDFCREEVLDDIVEIRMKAGI